MVVCRSTSLTVRHMIKVTTQQQPALGQEGIRILSIHARAISYANVSRKINSRAACAFTAITMHSQASRRPKHYAAWPRPVKCTSVARAGSSICRRVLCIRLLKEQQASRMHANIHSEQAWLSAGCKTTYLAEIPV